jgi:hypothetical protein
MLPEVEKHDPMTQTALASIGWRAARTLSATRLKINLEIRSPRLENAAWSPAS